MFKAVINAETLRDAIESVSSLVDEVKFSISEKGLELKAVDPANVAMVSLKIGADAFEFFKADGGEIGVDLPRAVRREGHQLELGTFHALDAEEALEVRVDHGIVLH